MSTLIYPLLWLLSGGAGSGGAAPPTSTAAAPAKAADTDQALAEVASATRALEARALEKQKKQEAHAQQLLTIEKLRRSRASWNRDRKLREARAAAQQSAAELAKLEAQIAAAQQTIRPSTFPNAVTTPSAGGLSAPSGPAASPICVA